MNFTISHISPQEAQELCREIMTDLPEYFGLPEANARYLQGLQTRLSLAARHHQSYVGLLTLDFPYPSTAQIYWMGVKRSFQGQGIGSALIKAARNEALSHGAYTLTVETLSPAVADKNYLKTFQFYKRCGFHPLFDLQPAGYQYLMVYLQQRISLRDCSFIDLTHTLTDEIPCWDGTCGFKHRMRDDYDQAAFVKFRTYDLHMQAGIGTHMDAPAHCIPGGQPVNELELEQLIVPCVVIDVSQHAYARYSLSVKDIEHFETQNGMIPPNHFVIVNTGWSQYWRTPEKYRNNYLFPSISQEAAEFLLNRHIVGLGIDTLSPDRPEDGYPVHQLILGAGKYIIENIAHAENLPAVGSHILALPLKIAGGTEAPMRLVAIT